MSRSAPAAAARLVTSSRGVLELKAHDYAADVVIAAPLVRLFCQLFCGLLRVSHISHKGHRILQHNTAAGGGQRLSVASKTTRIYIPREAQDAV